RAQLRQQWPVWRRDHTGTDPRDRQALPHDRVPVRARAHGWLDGWVGRAGAADPLPWRLRWRVGTLPRSARLPELSVRERLRGLERVREDRWVGAAARDSVEPHGGRPNDDDGPRGESGGAGDRVEGTFGWPVGWLAG